MSSGTRSRAGARSPSPIRRDLARPAPGEVLAPRRGTQPAAGRSSPKALDQRRLAGAVRARRVTISPSATRDGDAAQDVDLRDVAGERSSVAASDLSMPSLPPLSPGARDRRRSPCRRDLVAAAPSAMTGPRPSRSTRSARVITTSMSCSTKRKVCPSRRRAAYGRAAAAERRVDPGHRLVEQHQRGSSSARGRLEQLALPARERAGVVAVHAVESNEPSSSAPGRHLALARATRRRKCGCADARRAGRAPPASCCRARSSPPSAFVIWKVRTRPRRAIRGRQAGDHVAAERPVPRSAR